MPSDTLTASVEELCRQAGDADQYQRLRRFLKNFAEDLCAAGLAHKSNPLLHLVFNPFVNLIVCLWCLFGPAAALTEPGPEIAAVSVGLIIAVMVFRAALVDVGLKLTPEGGRILAQAKATVRWAKMEILATRLLGETLPMSRRQTYFPSCSQWAAQILPPIWPISLSFASARETGCK